MDSEDRHVACTQIIFEFPPIDNIRNLIVDQIIEVEKLEQEIQRSDQQPKRVRNSSRNWKDFSKSFQIIENRHISNLRQLAKQERNKILDGREHMTMEKRPKRRTEKIDIASVNGFQEELKGVQSILKKHASNYKQHD